MTGDFLSRWRESVERRDALSGPCVACRLVGRDVPATTTRQVGSVTLPLCCRCADGLDRLDEEVDGD